MMFSNILRTKAVEGSGTTRWTAVVCAAALTCILLLAGLLSTPSTAHASGAMVELGAAGSFSVLGASTVTNTGPTNLGGDLGVSPGTAITGFPPGTLQGTTHSADAHPAPRTRTCRPPTTTPPAAPQPRRSQETS